jgi:hypothetical protein
LPNYLNLFLSREIYSQIGCSLARSIAIFTRNIAMLIGKLTEQLATVSGRLTSCYIRYSTFSYLNCSIYVRENASHSHSSIILKYEFVFIWKKVKPLGNMLRKLHYRRLQIDQAKLTINIAMFRAILQCILQENTRFEGIGW